MRSTPKTLIVRSKKTELSVWVCIPADAWSPLPRLGEGFGERVEHTFWVKLGLFRYILSYPNVGLPCDINTFLPYTFLMDTSKLPSDMVDRQRSRSVPRNSRSYQVSRTPRVSSRHFHLVIPNLTQYTSFQALLKLKGDTLLRLRQRQRHLQYWSIAVQTHPTTGVPHLDILILYRQSVRKTLNHYDYLGKHGHLNRYRTLTEAILRYGRKQDVSPLTNLPEDVTHILQARTYRAQPHVLLRQAMLRDPFHFEPIAWLKRQGLMADTYRTSTWQRLFALLHREQQVQCNRLLHQRPGFVPLTRSWIQKRLTPSQLILYDSWPGYQVIVDHLNGVITHGSRRPFKTRQLLIVGPAGTGKTSLISEPGHVRTQPTVQDLTSTYHMGMRHWFPKYQSGVYRVILWDQFKLTAYPYDTLLKFLQGSPMDLPYHGGATKKTDNPLIFMTSNMTLQQHICHKFTALSDRALARQNLAARITQVIIPRGLNLFLLRRLIAPQGS